MKSFYQRPFVLVLISKLLWILLFHRYIFRAASCQPGSFSFTPTEIDCADGFGDRCPGGGICYPGQSCCVLCYQGCYCPDGTNRYSCAAGYQSSNQGATKCAACPVGKYEEGKINCNPCSPGKYSNTSASTTCRNCRGGEYSSVSGATYCQSCEIGTFGTIEGSSTSNDCQPCPLGTYGSEAGQSQCVKCPRGTYQPSEGGILLQSCLFCSAGTYSIMEGATSSGTCQLCPEGKTSFQGSSACFQCPKGSYSSETGTCESCTAGKYSADGLNCQSCLPGSFSGPGASSCSPCAPGSFQNEANSISCQECNINQFSRSNATSCISCPWGKVTTTKGQSNCIDPPVVPSSLIYSSGSNLAFPTLENMVGSGLISYVICSVTVCYIILSIIIIKTREKNDKLCKFGTFYVILTFTLLGASFISEIFLIVGLIRNRQQGAGYVILFGRLIFVPCSLYIQSIALAPKKLTNKLVSDNNRLDVYLEQECMLKYSKLYGVIAFLSLTDTSMLQFWPWRTSAFAETTHGCPNMLTLRVITTAKVTQSIISSITQVYELAHGEKSSEPAVMAFYGFNLVFALSPTIIVILESFIRFKLIKKMSTAVPEKTVQHTSLQAWLSQSLVGAPASIISKLVDAFREEGILTQKHVLDCKKGATLTVDDLKVMAAGKLNKVQMLDLIAAYNTLTDDSMRETTVESPRETFTRTNYNESFAEKTAKIEEKNDDANSIVEMGTIITNPIANLAAVSDV